MPFLYSLPTQPVVQARDLEMISGSSLSPSSPNPISRPFPLYLSMCFRAYLLFCTLTLPPEVQGLGLAPLCDCQHPWASFQLLPKGTFQNAIWTWTSHSPSCESFLTACSVDWITLLNQASLHHTASSSWTTPCLIVYPPSRWSHFCPHQTPPFPYHLYSTSLGRLPWPLLLASASLLECLSLCARLLHCTLHMAL